jgi:hypothetical protein
LVAREPWSKTNETRREESGKIIVGDCFNSCHSTTNKIFFIEGNKSRISLSNIVSGKFDRKTGDEFHSAPVLEVPGREGSMPKTVTRSLFLLTVTLLLLVSAQGALAGEVQVKHSATAYGTYAELNISLSKPASPFIVLCAKPPTIKEGYYPKGTALPPSCPAGQGVWGKVSVGNSLNHKVTIYDPQKPLQSNTQYTYIIQVNDGENNKTVKIGGFRTKVRSAIIYVTSIQVLNDSDSSGSGEINFSFYLDGKLKIKIPKNTKYYEWSTGQAPLTFDNNFTIIAPSGLAKTKLSVTGLDDDSDILDDMSKCGAGTNAIPNPPNGSDSCGDWTTESASLRLTDSAASGPGKEEVKLPFTIHANPTNGSTLQFIVKGYVRILYV